MPNKRDAAYFARRKVLPGFPWEGTFQTRAEIEAYFGNEKIQCLLCGKWYKIISSQHLARIHNITIDEYRQRYGLPWSRGLTGTRSHEKYGDVAREKIAEGKIGAVQSRNGSHSSQRPYHAYVRKWQPDAYEAVLKRMQEQGRTLTEVCRDPDFPASGAVRWFASTHPDFAVRLQQAHFTLPYSKQLSSGLVSPQFQIECQNLYDEGMNVEDIAKLFHIGHKSVANVVEIVRPPRWYDADYEAILRRMQEQQRLLREVCQDPDMPSITSWLCYVKTHPEFAEKAQQIHASLPYPVQMRSRRTSPQLREECRRLRSQGMSVKEIATSLGVSKPTVKRVTRGVPLPNPPLVWKQADYEAILKRMQTQGRTLSDVCQDHDLPSINALRRFIKKHPEFGAQVEAAKLRLPYPIQLRSGITSLQFRSECQRLRAQGMTIKEIAKTLGASINTVRHVVGKERKISKKTRRS